MKISRFILVLAAFTAVPALSRSEVVDGVKAIVNDKVITYQEVLDYARESANALRQQYASQPEVYQRKVDQLLNDALDQLEEHQLILHSFDTEGYKLPDGLVDDLLQERIRQQFGDRVTLMKTLQAQNMTLEKYRDQIRDQYITTVLRRQTVDREIIVSPVKILNYYQQHQSEFKLDDQVKLRMIVLNKTSANDTNAVELAREVQTKLKDGAAFAEMATIYSQGSQKHVGGDWGWVERPVLRKELADVAFGLKSGQVSDPIDTPDAVYIMLVEDKKGAAPKALADVRKEIEKTLRAEQQAYLNKKWIDGLKRKTFISTVHDN
jgi:peptidyl-prolyl cis-trans isomerase SurA